MIRSLRRTTTRPAVGSTVIGWSGPGIFFTWDIALFLAEPAIEPVWWWIGSAAVGAGNGRALFRGHSSAPARWASRGQTAVRPPSTETTELRRPRSGHRGQGGLTC